MNLKRIFDNRIASSKMPRVAKKISNGLYRHYDNCGRSNVGTMELKKEAREKLKKMKW